MGPNLTDVIEGFNFHPPRDESISNTHAEARDIMKQAALWVFDNVPASAERTTAINKIREAMMWANAAIAIHQ